jgi:hypothetical protein
MPKLLETFDQLIRSSEIRSSDPLSLKILSKTLNQYHLREKISSKTKRGFAKFPLKKQIIVRKMLKILGQNIEIG